MGKFINKSNKMAVQSLVQGLTKKLDNPYYIFTDKKPTIVTYFNINENNTTTDDASKQMYASLGDNSPIRYNKINEAVLYGIDRLTVDLDEGEFGLESSPIEGEAYILPNTFQPYPDDYFSISYLNKNILFRVTSVNVDTLNNGSNFYKINYKLDQYNYDEIMNQVVEEFSMIINNVGTQFNSVIRSNDYELIDKLDDILLKLKTYYCNLFFNNKVQTFTYSYNSSLFYDPYAIEFLIRNNILEGSEYLYISHQLRVNKTFSIDYDKSFFRYVELRDKNIKLRTAYGLLITDPTSLLSTRYEDYYYIDYNNGNTLCGIVPTVDIKLLNAIDDVSVLDDNKLFYKIISNYFNNVDMQLIDIITIVENIDYCESIELFYNIPILIYIIETYIKKLLIK